MFQTIRSYIFWAYERGSVPYDVMVTLILAFMFLSPRFINYNDQSGRDCRAPRERSAGQRGRHHRKRQQPFHVPGPRR